MSYRTEWFDAARTSVEVLSHGAEIQGSEEPVEREVAVHFGADTGAVIEGSLREVRELIASALTQLNQFPAGFFAITTGAGERIWFADSIDHAIEQHRLAFPEEPIESVSQTSPQAQPTPGTPVRATITAEGLWGRFREATTKLDQARAHVASAASASSTHPDRLTQAVADLRAAEDRVVDAAIDYHSLMERSGRQ